MAFLAFYMRLSFSMSFQVCSKTFHFVVFRVVFLSSGLYRLVNIYAATN